MAPPQVVDAVVAHELCHLRHLNHGKRFYALLDKVCPWRAMADGLVALNTRTICLLVDPA